MDNMALFHYRSSLVVVSEINVVARKQPNIRHCSLSGSTSENAGPAHPFLAVSALQSSTQSQPCAWLPAMMVSGQESGIAMLRAHFLAAPVFNESPFLTGFRQYHQS
jgi:hypothetical protein